MTKVKLPKEIAEAIDHLRTITTTNYDVIRVVEFTDLNPVVRKVYDWAYKTSGKGTPDLLMQALVNGYEIEKTPEELRAIAHGKVRDYYAELKRKESRARFWDDYEEVLANMRKRHATTDVLRMLGIKIEGVNA